MNRAAKFQENGGETRPVTEQSLKDLNLSSFDKTIPSCPLCGCGVDSYTVEREGGYPPKYVVTVKCHGEEVVFRCYRPVHTSTKRH